MGLKLSKLKQHKVFQNMLYVNVLTTGGLLAAGDVVTQQIEMAMDKDRTQKFNPKRTERMFLIGLCLGPFGHLWYTKFVEKLVPGAPSTTTALKKILADQIIAGPFFCSAFFFGMGLLEGRGMSGAVAEVKDKFLTVYLIDWCLWPPAQFINFRYLPVEYRVIYVACITLCWNVFLSYFKHMDSPKYQKTEEQMKK